MFKPIHPLFPCNVEITHKLQNKLALRQEAEYDLNQATITISPLEPGLGQIMGNLLRRLLFKYSSGFAVTSVWISGIQHELSPLKGVQEDLTDILYRISKVSIRMDHHGPGRVFLKKEGPGEISSDDLIPSSGVTILSKSFYLLTLNTNGSIWMILNVESGRGNFEGQNIRLQHHRKQFLDDSFKLKFGGSSNYGTTLSIPHQFGPVVQTSYEIRNYTHYDELILNIETNGSISAIESFESAFSFFLQKFLQVQKFVSLKKTII